MKRAAFKLEKAPVVGVSLDSRRRRANRPLFAALRRLINCGPTNPYWHGMRGAAGPTQRSARRRRGARGAISCQNAQPGRRLGPRRSLRTRPDDVLGYGFDIEGGDYDSDRRSIVLPRRAARRDALGRAAAADGSNQREYATVAHDEPARDCGKAFAGRGGWPTARTCRLLRFLVVDGATRAARAAARTSATPRAASRRARGRRSSSPGTQAALGRPQGRAGVHSRAVMCSGLSPSRLLWSTFCKPSSASSTPPCSRAVARAAGPLWTKGR